MVANPGCAQLLFFTLSPLAPDKFGLAKRVPPSLSVTTCTNMEGPSIHHTVYLESFSRRLLVQTVYSSTYIIAEKANVQQELTAVASAAGHFSSAYDPRTQKDDH